MMSEETRKAYSEQYSKFFDFAIVFYALFFAIKYSQLDYSSFLRLIKQFFFILSIGFSFLSIIKNYKWNLYGISCFLCLTLIPVYLRLLTNSTVLVETYLIMASYNIPFSHIARKCLQAILLIFLVVLSSLSLGIVEDGLYYRDKDTFENNFAHDLGFKYYSYYAYLAMGFVQCLIYRWRKKMNLPKIILLLVISYVMFILSSTRLQMYSCMAFIGFCIILPFVPKFIFNNKLSGFLSLILYPGICVVLYYVSKYSILSLFLYNFDEINRMTSGRLRLNEEAFVYYDANLWGNKMEFDTEIGTNTYFYVDSGYLHTLLESGIVYTALIMLLYSVLFYKVYKAKAYFLYIWLGLYSLICISNGLLTSLLANPILLLAFSSVEVISHDYELGSYKRTVKKSKPLLAPSI